MKKLLIFVVVVLGCLVAMAGPLDSTTVKLTNIKTNASAVSGCIVTNGTPLYGELYAIIVDIQGYASPTIDIDVVTKNSEGTGRPRTLYSADAVTTTNFTVYPRQYIHNTAGTVVTSNDMTRIPLVGDYVIVSAYDANTNSIIDVKTTIVTDK